MKIVIEINDEGVGTYQQGNNEPQPCVMLNMSQSVEQHPVYMLGEMAPLTFVRSPDMKVELSLNVMLPRPPAAERSPMPETTVWNPDDYCENDWHYCDYYDCNECYEEE